jgi:outer membrane murein-binding lipoprotein Lpp
LRQIANTLDRPDADQLAAQVDKVYALVSALGSDRAQIAAQASTASETADRVARRMTGAAFDDSIAYARVTPSRSALRFSHCSNNWTIHPLTTRPNSPAKWAS